MTQVLIAFVFFVIAISLMGLALHFSKYKMRVSGCCGEGHCSTNKNDSTIQSCYKEKLTFVKNYQHKS